MKHQTIITTLCALLLGLLGCERKTIYPVSDGSFSVNSDTGMATGKDAFGIDFEVVGADRAESKSEVHGNPKYSSRAEITLADDLTIELVTKDEGKLVNLRLNGRNFGDLKRGDKVVIDEERNVTVNGEKRTTAESPPE
jgi:hypothetical protein